MPVPVHNHSEYSALDGYGRPAEIASQIEKLGYRGAFLTDHGTVAGFAPFAEEMAKRDLFAGFGMEAYHARIHRKVTPEPIRETKIDPVTGKKTTKNITPRDASHLILLAKDATGLRNLNILSDLANREGFYYAPRLDYELLEKYGEGLICTTACMGGLVAQGLKAEWAVPKEVFRPDEDGGWDRELRQPKLDDWQKDSGTEHLNKLLNIFKDDLFIELHTYEGEEHERLNSLLIEQAQSRGIPVVYANDAHYPCADDYHNHELMLNMQMGHPGPDRGDYGHQDENGDWHHHPQDLFIMGEQDIRDALSYLPQRVVDEALANSDLIADMCKNAALPEKRMHLPKYKATPSQLERYGNPSSNKELMLNIMEEGLVERYGSPLPEEIVDRAAYEFEAIVDAFDEQGLQDYFLINWDWITDFCKRKGIRTGPGRGSAGGSILAYALGITKVDPIKHGLIFERFWNPGRADGLPDIDTDVPKFRREEVIEYLRKRYGRERVLPIGNHIRMQPKSAIDKAGIALFGDKKKHPDGPPYALMTLMKKQVDRLVDAGQQPGWEDIMGDDEVWGEIQNIVMMDEEKMYRILEVAIEMTGRIQSYGRHASAIVVSDVDLPEVLPCRLATDDDSGTKGDKIPVTQLEMNGVEAAGFLKLDALGLKTLDVLDRTVELAGVPDFDFNDIDFEDQPVEFWEQIEKGLTLGFFQIERGHAARRIGKDLKPRSIDELAAIVALNRPGPLRSGMVDRYIARKNGTEATEYSHPILNEILKDTYGDFLYQEQVIAFFQKIGYNPSDADHIRKILGKKKVELMEAEYPRYLERASEYMPEAKAKSIWDEIIGFSKYSFNKSHAVEYAYVLAWTMYAKYTWPTDFIMASIQILSKSTVQDKMDKIGGFVSEGKRMGVDVRGPHINLSQQDIAKVDGTIYYGLYSVKWVGEDAAEWILENGPFQSREHMEDVLAEQAKLWTTGGLTKRGNPQYEQQLAAHKASRHPRSPKQRCTAKVVKSLWDAGAFDSLQQRDIASEKKAALELELLGISLTNPEEDLAREYSAVVDRLSPITVVESGREGSFEVPGVVSEVKKTKIRADANWKPGEEMAILTLRWAGVEARVAAFPDEWTKFKFMLKPGTFGKFNVKTNARGASLRKAELIG